MEYFYRDDSGLKALSNLAMRTSNVAYVATPLVQHVWLSNAAALLSNDVGFAHVHLASMDCDGDATVSGLANCKNLHASNAILVDVTCSNLAGMHLVFQSTAASNATAVNLNYECNLSWQGYSLYDECPLDTNAWRQLLPFTEDIGLIHESWLRRPVTAASVLRDLYNLADGGLDVAEAIYDMWKFFNPATDTPRDELLAAGMKAALDELLDGDGSSDQDLVVSWSNVKNKPVGTYGDHLGVKGDLHVSDTQTLKVMPSAQLTRDPIRNNVTLNPFGGETLLDFGNKEAFLQALNVGCNVRILHNERDFQVHDWHFSSNAVWSGVNCNNQMAFSSCNVRFTNPIHVPAVGNQDSMITFRSNSLSMAFGNNEIHVASNAWSFATSNAIHAQINTDGTLLVNSNICMSNTAIVRAVNATSEGRLEVSPEAFRIYSSSNSLAFSVNSNGIFPLTRSKILGKLESIAYPDPNNPLGSELTLHNFPRVEFSLADGLKYGYGLQYDLANPDIFKVTRDAELYSLDTSSVTLRKIVDNQARVCARLKVGACEISTDGSISVGKLQILSSGKIMYDDQVLVSYQGRIPGHRIDFGGEFEANVVRPVRVSEGAYTRNFFNY
jgi:hypothetical protein